MREAVSLLIGCGLLAVGQSVASPDECAATLPTTDALRKQVEARGAFMVCSDLFADRPVWACIERRLAAGERPWFEIWHMLRIGAPEGPAEAAGRAAGYALKHDPRQVFDFFGTGPCEGLDVKAKLGAQRAVDELRARRAVVAGLTDTGYHMSRDECLEMIDRAIERVGLRPKN